MIYTSTGTGQNIQTAAPFPSEWPMAPPPAVSAYLPAAPAAAPAGPGTFALILAGLAVLWMFSGEGK